MKSRVQQIMLRRLGEAAPSIPGVLNIPQVKTRHPDLVVGEYVGHSWLREWPKQAGLY
jgi:hypothetical protein